MSQEIDPQFKLNHILSLCLEYDLVVIYITDIGMNIQYVEDYVIVFNVHIPDVNDLKLIVNAEYELNHEISKFEVPKRDVPLPENYREIVRILSQHNSPRISFDLEIIGLYLFLDLYLDMYNYTKLDKIYELHTGNLSMDSDVKSISNYIEYYSPLKSD